MTWFVVVIALTLLTCLLVGIINYLVARKDVEPRGFDVLPPGEKTDKER